MEYKWCKRKSYEFQCFWMFGVSYAKCVVGDISNLKDKKEMIKKGREWESWYDAFDGLYCCFGWPVTLSSRFPMLRKSPIVLYSLSRTLFSLSCFLFFDFFCSSSISSFRHVFLVLLSRFLHSSAGFYAALSSLPSSPISSDPFAHLRHPVDWCTYLLFPFLDSLSSPVPPLVNFRILFPQLCSQSRPTPISTAGVVYEYAVWCSWMLYLWLFVVVGRRRSFRCGLIIVIFLHSCILAKTK